MHTIHKFALPIDDRVAVDMPVNAQVLSFQNQGGIACVWALIDPAQPMGKRRFKVVGTGHPIDDLNGLRFVSTAQFAGGSLVFHLFEVDQVPDLVPTA